MDEYVSQQSLYMSNVHHWGHDRSVQPQYTLHTKLASFVGTGSRPSIMWDKGENSYHVLSWRMPVLCVYQTNYRSFRCTKCRYAMFNIHLTIPGYILMVSHVVRTKVYFIVHFDLIFLTHWGWDKMADIFQTTFSNAFFNQNIRI